MNDLIDWVEQAALENIRFHLQNADNLAREATTTLTIFLAGIGGTMAHAVKGFEKSPVTDGCIASAVLAAYLTVLAALLVFKCMKIAPIPAPTNEPKNLYQPKFDLAKLKEIELDNLQQRIEQAVERNDTTTGWLNKARMLATFSPVIWVLAFYLLPHLFDLVKVAG
jgi:hypothetical protein